MIRNLEISCLDRASHAYLAVKWFILYVIFIHISFKFFIFRVIFIFIYLFWLIKITISLAFFSNYLFSSYFFPKLFIFTFCSRIIARAIWDANIRKFLLDNREIFGRSASLRCISGYTYAAYTCRRGHSRSRDRARETCLCVRTDRMYGPACTPGPTAKPAQALSTSRRLYFPSRIFCRGFATRRPDLGPHRLYKRVINPSLFAPFRPNGESRGSRYLCDFAVFISWRRRNHPWIILATDVNLVPDFIKKKL